MRLLGRPGHGADVHGAEGIENGQAIAQAHAVEIALDRICRRRHRSASWMPKWRPWPKTKTVIFFADRDEDPKRTEQG